MSSPELQFDPFDILPDDLPPAESDTAPMPDSKAALKQQVANRLAAHRSKRGRKATGNLIAIPNLEVEPAPRAASQRSATKSVAAPSASRAGKSRASRIAAAVAERYAHSTTYREFLAAEAERAIAEANATAEVAARNAEAVTAVQQQLLAELDLWDKPSPQEPEAPVPHASQRHRDESETVTVELLTPEPPTPEPPTLERSSESLPRPILSGLTVRLYEDVGLPQNLPRISSAPESPEDEAHALNQLDDEIAFRHTPVFDAPAGPPIAISANLIEFPRQLVAARKSRPRIAEGPLREEADTAPGAAQLRIFEVDATQFSTAPVAEPESSLPEWSSIHLDATPVVLPEFGHGKAAATSSEAHLQTQLYVPLQIAPVGDRLMAAVVDACILGASLLAAIVAFSYAVKSIPAGPVALIASAATLLVLFVLYQMLFFTFACATPGMRYARIGLCTFSDDNPTRAEMRRRVWFILLAACPLGLGILWALLDEDSLGWHDRLSRIYQRSY